MTSSKLRFFVVSRFGGLPSGGTLNVEAPKVAEI